MARCEDFPCCGHEAGCCPDFDDAGQQLNMRCVCGAVVPLHSSSSCCESCLRDPDGFDDDFCDDDEDFEDEVDAFDDGFDGDSRSMELHENAQFEQADEWFGDYGCNEGDF